MLKYCTNIGACKMEFISFRGKNLEATVIMIAGQEFVMASVADRFDSIAADVYSQQKIDIVPGLKITEKKTGVLFEILSKPEGYSRLVSVKNVRRNLSGINISEEDLRKNYRFVG